MWELAVWDFFFKMIIAADDSSTKGGIDLVVANAGVAETEQWFKNPDFIIDVNFRGRILKIAGDRTFDTWTITVINDTDFSIRSAFEKWMNSINRLSDATGANNPADYQEDAYVHQLDRDGSTLRSYRFYDVFPTNISQMDLSYETVDTIEEFTVELQVLYFESIKGVGDNAGGESIS